MLPRSATLILLQLVLFVAVVRAAGCNGQPSVISVDADGGMVYSDGYPQHYDNSAVCQWLLTASASSTVVQIETLDMDLEQAFDGTCIDHITVYDGDSEGSTLLKQWCGTDRISVQSTGLSLFLKFVSSPAVTRKGFAIAYRQITPYSLSCQEGTATPLAVGSTPVLYNFQHPAQKVSLCQWRLHGEGSLSLKLTVVKTTGDLPCDEGYLALHDGQDTSAPEVLHWCGERKAPFSVFYPSGSALIVLSLNISRVQDYSFHLSLKAQTRQAQGNCDDQQMPVVELQKDSAPLLIVFPYVTNSKGESCPVQFRKEDSSGGIRVNVITEDNQPSSCNASTAVSVYKGQAVSSSSSVDSECWRGKMPIFLSNTVDVIIATVSGKTSVVKVVPIVNTCSGWIIRQPTRRDSSGTVVIPEGNSGTVSHFQNYCITRYLFEASEEMDHPRVQFEGKFEDKDLGDRIKVYDGNSTDSQVISVLNQTGYFTKWVVAGGRQMLVEFSADDTDDRGFVALKYSSVPDGHTCQGKTIDVKATSAPHNLTSPNYPGFFPIDFVCRYAISTEKEGEVIHLRVLHVDFGTSCGDQLEVYSGRKIYSQKNKLGLVCSGNPRQATEFESEGDTMTLIFTSDSQGNFGDGWNMQYYSAPPSDVSITPSPTATSSTTPPEGENIDWTIIIIIVGAAMGVVVVILIIIIIYCAFRTKRIAKAKI